MTIEVILLCITTILTFWAIWTLFFRVKKPEQQRIADIDQSVYTGMGSLSRLFRLFSINANPAFCLLAMFMFFLAIAFMCAEYLTVSVLEILLLAFALFGIAMYILKELGARKRRNFESGLVEAIEIMQAASMSGSTPQSALQAVADSATGDVQQEFKSMYRSLQYGSSIESATARISAIYDSEGARMLTQVLIARWNVGGSLEELMASVARMIRERLTVKMQVAAKLSGAKFSALFMGIAPYLLIPFFLSTEPQWLQIFLTHPNGLMVLGIAFLLQITGVVWLRKVLRINL